VCIFMEILFMNTKISFILNFGHVCNFALNVMFVVVIFVVMMSGFAVSVDA